MEVQSLNKSETDLTIKLDEWDDVKIFRDPVHQYIEVPKIYTRYLIDTYDMQRIKDVAQSGLRSVYNAATHNRFSHSLGVYHLGKKAFKSLKKNIKNIVEKEGYQEKSGECVRLADKFEVEWIDYKRDLDLWEVLFQVACILHDIGHPAMSHTLEFLYDDIYMDVPDDLGEETRKYVGVSEEEYRRYKELRENYTTDKTETKFHQYLFKNILLEDEKKGYVEVQGNPHERMSAYYILSGVVAEKIVKVKMGSLADNIVKLICSFRVHCGISVDGMDRTPMENDQFYEIDITEFENLQFICRMITGQKYQCHVSDEIECVKNSIKNAIISLLNGTIDADSLDYIARNSYSAGYDTNNVDVNRLCTAYSVRFRDNMFELVFEKNALSVLEGFVSARNFEPSWLYSHHKIVYDIDVLYKYMYTCVVELLYRDDLEKWSDILVENFYGDKKPLKSGRNDFYSQYIDVAEIGVASFTESECDEIMNCLRQNNSLSMLLDEVLKCANGSYGKETKEVAWKIYNILRREDKLTGEHEDELESELESYFSGMDELDDLKKKILQYAKVDDKKIEKLLEKIKNINIILNKKTEDIYESSLGTVIQQTKVFLSKLISSDENELEHSQKLLRENKQELLEFLNALCERYSELTDIMNLYFSYVLSPIKTFANEKFLFDRSNDSNLDSLFKTWYFRIEDKNRRKEKKLEKIEETYLELGREYFRRQYRASLWKSYQEYKIFIDEIADTTKIESSTVNEYFLELIQNGGKIITFHNDKQKSTQSTFDNQRIYVYDEEYGEGDNNTEKRNFHEVFKAIENTDFIIKIHEMKYKDFRNSIKIAFKEKVFPLGDVIDLIDMKAKRFPFIFLKISSGKDGKGIDRRKYIDEIGEKLTKYCLERSEKGYIIKKEAGDRNMVNNQGKVFRDVVHGDIVIPKRFMPLIETAAFQRLRRIKQLSTADFVFPNAVHTRFAHCIGTFHVMTLIVEHFEDIFMNLGVPYNQEEIDALLVAALLHDIGHGPYSHNFERLAENTKKHEEWSTEIIEASESGIRTALEAGFPQYNQERFVKQIKSYIEEDCIAEERKNLSFYTIFKSLISSQLDADRLDYLLRDSFNTGITYGNIDANAIIRGMQVTEYANCFYVCITEDTVSYIEQFIFGRYKMYDSVYYNAYKVFSETLVIKILEYVKRNADELDISQDDNITALLNNKLELKEYLALDDSYVNGLFSKWKESKDKVLSEMCKALLKRNGYKRLYIMNQGATDLYDFKQELKKIFHLYFPGNEQEVESLNSFIFAERRFSAYRNNAKKYDSTIWILTNDGLLKDFSEVSPMFSTEMKGHNWDSYKCFIYYNRDLLEAELNYMREAEDFERNKTLLLAEIDQLIRNSNLRNYIEIEEKYSCTCPEIEKVKDMLDNKDSMSDCNYKISDAKEIDQEDTYYDTEDMAIAKKQCSFRCRRKSEGKYKITIKAPTPNEGFDRESQVARFEYEQEIQSNDLAEAVDFICRTLKNVIPDKIANLSEKNINEIFKPQLIVHNHRSKYLVSNAADANGFVFSVCLDRVRFQHEAMKKDDYQIEVELESDYIHRVSMKFFTEKIEKCLNKPVKHEQYSKYIKGLDVLGLYHPD